MKLSFTLFKSIFLLTCFFMLQHASAQTFNASTTPADTSTSDNLFIPNTFTPNNDHINDLFIVKGNALANGEYEIGIYDRWGQCVYQSQNSNAGWDGKIGSDDAPEDVYVYKIRIIKPHHEIIRLGKITLIR